MIKLTYKELNGAEFNAALDALAKQTNFKDFQAAYNVSRILRQVKNEIGIARELFTKMVEQYYVKDETGKPKIAEKPNPYTPWEIEESKQKEFDAKMEDFLKTKVELKSYKIKQEDLGSIKLTPQQILALEVIFDSESFALQV